MDREAGKGDQIWSWEQKPLKLAWGFFFPFSLNSFFHSNEYLKMNVIRSQ